MTEKQENFTLLDGQILFKRSIYNPTSDAVWAAAYAPINNVKRVLDVGIGTGGISLCLLHHNPDAKITGIDNSQTMLDACLENFALNNKPVKLLAQDIMTWKTPETFDLVITNPPYFTGTPSQKNDAHHNIEIDKWVKRSVARVKPGGYFCIIIDALQFAKVVHILESKRFGDVQIFPLFGAKKTAERVLIRARSGVRTGSTIFAGAPMQSPEILRTGLTVDKLLATLEEQ